MCRELLPSSLTKAPAGSRVHPVRYHTRGGGTAARTPSRPDENRPPSSSAVNAAACQGSDAGPVLVDRVESAQSSPDAFLSDDLPVEMDHAHPSHPLHPLHPTHPSAVDAAAFERGLTHFDSFGREEGSGSRMPELPSNLKTPPSLPSIPQFMSTLQGHKSATLPIVVDGYAECSAHTKTPFSTGYADPVKRDNQAVFPLENVQEACLLRYWIEEISHWVRRIGQLPLPHLRNF